MYEVMDVARFILNYCSSHENPVSNLKLQKMLYYVWIDFFRSTENRLFTDEFSAWQFGPVSPNVYYEFCSYGGMPINFSFPEEVNINGLNTNHAKIIIESIKKLMSLSAWELVNRTHKEGSAWSLTYDNGNGKRAVIPFSLIVELEIRE